MPQGQFGPPDVWTVAACGGSLLSSRGWEMGTQQRQHLAPRRRPDPVCLDSSRPLETGTTGTPPLILSSPTCLRWSWASGHVARLQGHVLPLHGSLTTAGSWSLAPAFMAGLQCPSPAPHPVGQIRFNLTRQWLRRPAAYKQTLADASAEPARLLSRHLCALGQKLC